MNAYIKDLFAYLSRFEDRPGEFDTEAFLQTYQGVYAVFQALRKEREKAVETDHFFISQIKQIPLNKSDLRQLTVQLLITYFEAEADVDGQSNQSYLYCRSLREVKQDIPYFEKYLVPMLFADGALNWNLRLNTFFLEEIARYMNRYGGRFDAEMSPEAFGGLTDPSKFLHLARRRRELGADLLKDRSSLEFHLQQVNGFSKLAARGRTHREHLSEWGYLKTSNFWARVSEWLREFGGKLAGAFSSWRYFRLVMSQRNAAYLYCSIIIVICILLAIYVPSKWKSYSETQLNTLVEHADELQQQSGR